MDYTEILFKKDEQIATICLNSPKTINSLSKKMVFELSHLLDEIKTDDDIKVVVLKAEGKHFCAGHNLSEMQNLSAKENNQLFENCSNMMLKLHKIPQIVIAQVNGIATAAGCQLAAWCDLTIASEDARFSTPGVKIGLFCSTPMVAITRAIGRKMAMEMLVTGREFGAQEAKNIGLINRVVRLDELDSSAHELAEQICKASKYTLGVGKQAFYAQIDETEEKAFDFANKTMALNNMSEDAQIGINAFLQKTTPVWKNK